MFIDPFLNISKLVLEDFVGFLLKFFTDSLSNLSKIFAQVHFFFFGFEGQHLLVKAAECADSSVELGSEYLKVLVLMVSRCFLGHLIGGGFLGSLWCALNHVIQY